MCASVGPMFTCRNCGGSVAVSLVTTAAPAGIPHGAFPHAKPCRLPRSTLRLVMVASGRRQTAIVVMTIVMPITEAKSRLLNLNKLWRRGWDSNPRYGLPHAGFQDRCLKPLGHPSKIFISFCNLDFRSARLVAFATISLPNIFRPRFYSDLQRGVNGICSVLLHPRHDVGVEIKRDTDIRMPKALTCNLRMHPICKHLCRMRMP